MELAEEYQLYLETPEPELLLAKKPAKRSSPVEPPSNPSRFYSLLADQNGGIDWLGAHLGCTPANRGVGLMEPRVFFQVGQNSRLSFVHPSPNKQDPMVFRMDLPYVNELRTCNIRLDGQEAAQIQLKRSEASRIVMSVLKARQHNQELKMAFVPLLVGSRDFCPPTDANRAPWHVLR
ncbi:MAG: hypothetical protein AAB383_03335 [Patescibacteria group bacterium]